MDLQELKKIYVFDREQLAHKIKQTVPGSEGEIIAEFLRVIGVPGWQFATLLENDVQKLSKHDPAITERLLRLQGKSPNERKTTIIRLYPKLAGRIRRRSSFLHLQPGDFAVFNVPTIQTQSPRQQTLLHYVDSLPPLSSSLSSEPPAIRNFVPESPTKLSCPTSGMSPSRASTPIGSSIYMSANTSQTSFHTAPSRHNSEVEVDDGDDDDDSEVEDGSPTPSPSVANFSPPAHQFEHLHYTDSHSYDGLTTCSEDSDDDESHSGSTDSLLTPLQVTPNLSSDLEHGDHVHLMHTMEIEQGDISRMLVDEIGVIGHQNHDTREARITKEAGTGHYDNLHSGLISEGKASSLDHPPPALHPLELSFPSTAPSLLTELSTCSPHFVPTPLSDSSHMHDERDEDEGSAPLARVRAMSSSSSAVVPPAGNGQTFASRALISPERIQRTSSSASAPSRTLWQPAAAASVPEPRHVHSHSRSSQQQRYEHHEHEKRNASAAAHEQPVFPVASRSRSKSPAQNEGQHSIATASSVQQPIQSTTMVETDTVPNKKQETRLQPGPASVVRRTAAAGVATSPQSVDKFSAVVSWFSSTLSL